MVMVEKPLDRLAIFTTKLLDQMNFLPVRSTLPNRWNLARALGPLNLPGFGRPRVRRKGVGERRRGDLEALHINLPVK